MGSPSGATLTNRIGVPGTRPISIKRCATGPVPLILTTRAVDPRAKAASDPRAASACCRFRRLPEILKRFISASFLVAPSLTAPPQPGWGAPALGLLHAEPSSLMVRLAPPSFAEIENGFQFQHQELRNFQAVRLEVSPERRRLPGVVESRAGFSRKFRHQRNDFSLPPAYAVRQSSGLALWNSPQSLRLNCATLLTGRRQMPDLAPGTAVALKGRRATR